MFVNLYKGNASAFLRHAQVPKSNCRSVALDRKRGMRFGLARRLLAAVSGEDIRAPDLSRRLNYGSKAAYRWESGEDRPRDKTVEELADLCQAKGLNWITAAWLERGAGEIAPVVIPASALAVDQPKETPVPRGAPLKSKRKPAQRGGDVAAKRRRKGA